MAGNTFGKNFRLSTFGESHGSAIGGVIDGCPAGLELDLQAIQYQLDRRRPGQSRITTQRKEEDKVEFLSGLFEGKTLGTPIGFIIPNQDAKSKDYSHIKDIYRPSHADFTYQEKYGIRDYRGGGRSSARETACRVVAGAIARQLLSEVSINAYVSQVGAVKLEKDYRELDFSETDESIVRCPDPETADRFIAAIKEVRKAGDTLGGIVSCVISGVPAGWGEPVFDKLHADMGKAMLSINAVKGFEYGSGFAGTEIKGSRHNDVFREGGGTQTNHSGGIQGGISNGEDIYFRVAFKPVATLMQDQETVNEKGDKAVAKGKGRHDPCVVPRAVPIVEAMAALVLADHFLASRINRIDR
ncbi:MAG: chorismate synthase [Owenweeksia sp.]